MAEDIAFRIQLGIILPKLEKKISTELAAIVEELANIVKAGTLDGGPVSMDEVKGIIMKDLEIFLTDSIIPKIEKKVNPPAEEPEEETAAEGGEVEGEEAPAE